MTTRKGKEVFLIPKLLATIKKNKLPTKGDVLGYYFYVKNSDKVIKKEKIICCGLSKYKDLSCGDDCVCAVKKVFDIYSNAGIPTIRPDHMKSLLQNLVKRHEKLNSLRKRDTDQEKEKRRLFVEELADLFDVMPRNVEKIVETDRLRNQEDKAEDIRFIQDQRGPRLMAIGAADKRYIKSSILSEQRRGKEVNRSIKLTNTEVQESSSETETEVSFTTTSSSEMSDEIF